MLLQEDFNSERSPPGGEETSRRMFSQRAFKTPPTCLTLTDYSLGQNFRRLSQPRVKLRVKQKRTFPCGLRTTKPLKFLLIRSNSSRFTYSLRPGEEPTARRPSARPKPRPRPARPARLARPRHRSHEPARGPAFSGIKITTW